MGNDPAERAQLAGRIAELLDSAGPVVSRHAAAAMADGARRLLGADMAVALTGAGGPDGQDGQPRGTVFVAVSDGVDTQIEHCHFDRDDPAEVCVEAVAEAVAEALRLLHRHLQAAPRPV